MSIQKDSDSTKPEKWERDLLRLCLLLDGTVDQDGLLRLETRGLAELDSNQSWVPTRKGLEACLEIVSRIPRRELLEITKGGKK